MVNTALLTSFVAAFAASLIRTNACEVGVFATVQEKVPGAAAVLALIIIQLEPLFVEYSILTLVILVKVQVIFWLDDAIHVSPPLGVRTVTLGVGLIVNTALLRSFTLAFEASLMRTRACVVGVFATVQEKVPADAAVLAVIVFQLEPLFVEYSILTLVILVDVQVIF